MGWLGWRGGRAEFGFERLDVALEAFDAVGESFDDVREGGQDVLGGVVLGDALFGGAGDDVPGEEPVRGGAGGGADRGYELDGWRLALHVAADVLRVEAGALADDAVRLVAEEGVEAFVDRGVVHAGSLTGVRRRGKGSGDVGEAEGLAVGSEDACAEEGFVGLVEVG